MLAAVALCLSVVSALLMGTSADSSAQDDPTASLQGTVLNEDGRPLRLITVFLYSRGLIDWSAVTDDAGRFSFADIPSGVELQVTYEDEEWYQYSLAGGATVLTLEAGEQRDLGSVELDDGINTRRSPQALDVSDRSLVTTSWKEVLVPAVKNAPSPRIRGCEVAPQSKRALRRVLTAVNWYRAIAGLDPVTLDGRLNRLAQQSSVIQNYLRTGEYLSHDPPRSTRCWSKAGADAAGRSNLASGANGGNAVALYMSDYGVPSAGHRMWILNPTASRFGSGDAGSYNSLYVVGPSNPQASQPPYVVWPSAGYFPYRETPATWSLRTSRQDIDLTRARVTLNVSTGQRIRAQRLSRDTSTLLWDLSAVPKVGNRKATRIKVTIADVKWRGVIQPPLSYSVQIVRSR